MYALVPMHVSAVVCHGHHTALPVLDPVCRWLWKEPLCITSHQPADEGGVVGLRTDENVENEIHARARTRNRSFANQTHAVPDST